MTGPYTLYISLPLVFMSFIVLALTYLTKRDDPTHKYYYFLSIVTLLWNLFHALFTVSIDTSMAEFWHRMQMLAIPFLPISIMLFVLKISGYEKFLKPKYLVLLCIMPAITVFLNFTNDFHHLFREYFAVIETSPVRIMVNERGPWFWVHTAYSYAITVTTLVVAIHRVKIESRPARLRYYLVLVGSSFTMFTNAIVLFVAPNTPIDSTLWGATFGLFFMYFAIGAGPSSSYILARNQVFENIGEYIFVLNISDGITDMNSPARGWLMKHGITSDPPTFAVLLAQLQERGATIEHDDDTDLREMFFLDEENSLFSSFVIKSKYLFNKRGDIVGAIVTFSDMTAIREALRDLQAISTIDELTGTYNRRGYERMLSQYNEDDMLPLCILMGDVNGLKHVNDTLGHGKGDYILRRAAQFFVECAGDEGAVARIGGDEFAVIIPNFDEDAAENLMHNIKKTFSRHEGQMHGAGIALGYAIKTSPRQDLAKIIDEADKRMYQDKRNDRRRREEA